MQADPGRWAGRSVKGVEAYTIRVMDIFDKRVQRSVKLLFASTH